MELIGKQVNDGELEFSAKKRPKTQICLKPMYFNQRNLWQMTNVQKHNFHISIHQ